MATEQGWTRIGRLLLDVSEASPLDEDAFVDWLDDCLDDIQVESLADLRLALRPRMLAWFGDHLRRMPEIVKDLASLASRLRIYSLLADIAYPEMEMLSA